MNKLTQNSKRIWEKCHLYIDFISLYKVFIPCLYLIFSPKRTVYVYIHFVNCVLSREVKPYRNYAYINNHIILTTVLPYRDIILY